MIIDAHGAPVDLDGLERKIRDLYVLTLEIQQLGIVPEWRTNPGINLVIELRKIVKETRHD